MKISTNGKPSSLKSRASQAPLAVFTALMTVSCAVLAKPVQAATFGNPANPIAVDLELSLLLDVSGSISTAEFNLQKQGYVNAFKDVSLWNAVSQGTLGKIAVNFIYWSSAAQQNLAVDWVLIDSFAAAQEFASLISATARPFNGTTAPGSAINYAVPLFGTETGGVQNGFNSARQVIDVSGDGQENSGANTATARNNALAKGIDAINGLPILSGNSSLQTWYINNIQGGNNSFVVPASNFVSFEDAVKRKLVREITPTPVPEASSLLGLAVVSGAAFSLRRKLVSKAVKAEA